VPRPPGGRPGGAPLLRRDPAPPGDGTALGELTSEPLRGVVVAGRCDRGLAPEAPAFAERAGYPLLADPLSGARRGAAAVAHYDLMDLPQPELVIRAGDLPTSKPLRTWLAGLACPQVSIDRHGAWRDPANVVGRSLRGDPRAILGAAEPAPAPPEWLAGWRAADARIAEAVAQQLGEQLTEPALAALLIRELPADATLFVAASMPIRDLEAFAPVREDAPRVLSNRGANGIDGTISSAFGVAAVSEGPVVALLGDVALAHDVGGLLAARRLGLRPTIIVIDNGGGAIFDFLPIARATDVFEQHIATPPGLRCADVAALYGLEHVRAQTLDEVRAAMVRPGALVEVPGERAANRALHAAIRSAAAAAPGA
jgi:2-succinyl-5-enolpyruvyl-6-hydroxy-3-cyclohexene-1-carboxylate synthase